MSVDAIKKFLESATEYPDTTMVTIGETQVPLGSLRALNAAQRTELENGIKANKEREAEILKERNKVIDTANKAAAAYAAAEEMRSKAAALVNTPAPNGADANNWRDDVWFKGVAKDLDERDKKYSALEGQLKQLATIVHNAATIWSQRGWDQEYNTIDFGKRDKKPTRDDLVKFAEENKILDRYGLPSVRAAWDKMSEADRLEELRKNEFERGREAGRMEQLAARIPPPNTPGPGQPVTMPKVSTQDPLGDLYGEAMKDPELRALLEQSAGAGLV